MFRTYDLLTMDDQTKSEYETKCQALRADLKSWESAWAKDNGGKKPGRDDIKRNPEIGRTSHLRLERARILTVAQLKSISNTKRPAMSSTAGHPRQQRSYQSEPNASLMNLRRRKHLRNEPSKPRPRQNHCITMRSWRKHQLYRESSSARGQPHH